MTVANMDKRPTKAEKIDGVFLNSGGTFDKVPLGVSSSLNEINQELPPNNQNGEDERRIRKKCLSCGNDFTCSPSENSDYCRNCEINRKRHILKENKRAKPKREIFINHA